MFNPSGCMPTGNWDNTILYFARPLLLLCYQRETWVGLDSVRNEGWAATQSSYLTPPPFFISRFILSKTSFILYLPAGEQEIDVCLSFLFFWTSLVIIRLQAVSLAFFSCLSDLPRFCVCLHCGRGYINNLIPTPFTVLFQSVLPESLAQNDKLHSILAVFISPRTKTWWNPQRNCIFVSSAPVSYETVSIDTLT